MQTLKLDVNDPKSIDEAAKKASEILQSGGTMVYPTDTTYGLGANALNEAAIEKIFRIKRRAKEKPLSIAVKDVAMTKKFAIVSMFAEKFLQKVWPGPITVILPKRSILPDILTAGRTIGLRYPNHPFCEAVFRYIDFPITATSANISRGGAVYNIQDLIVQFKDKKELPDIIIDAGTLPETPPSTIIDLAGTEPKILRVGPVKSDALLKIFKETAA